jgi:hypothetical protein
MYIYLNKNKNYELLEYRFGLLDKKALMKMFQHTRSISIVGAIIIIIGLII